MLPQVRGGKVRGLGVTSAERSKAAPDIPAIAETLPGYVATSWYGAGAPAGTPEPILARLEAAITAALATPEIQKRWTDDLGLDMPPAGAPGLRRIPGQRPQALGAGGEGVGREAGLSRLRLQTRPIRHPERSEGSHRRQRRAILRCAQDDSFR